LNFTERSFDYEYFCSAWQSVTNKAVQGTTTNSVIATSFCKNQKPSPTMLMGTFDRGRLDLYLGCREPFDLNARLKHPAHSSQLLLQFEYDCRAKIRKQVWFLNGHGKYTLTNDAKAVYDGELRGRTERLGCVQRRYMWGLGPSVATGAGGVGDVPIQDIAGGPEFTSRV